MSKVKIAIEVLQAVSTYLKEGGSEETATAMEVADLFNEVGNPNLVEDGSALLTSQQVWAAYLLLSASGHKGCENCPIREH